MKTTLLALVMLAFFAGCSSPKQDEDFTPYPGGKCCEEKPKV